MKIGFFQKVKSGGAVATPSLCQQKLVFGAKIIKSHVFRAWGPQNRIPDVKTIKKSLLKLKKYLLGVEIKPEQCQDLHM